MKLSDVPCGKHICVRSQLESKVTELQDRLTAAEDKHRKHAAKLISDKILVIEERDQLRAQVEVLVGKNDALIENERKLISKLYDLEKLVDAANSQEPDHYILDGKSIAYPNTLYDYSKDPDAVPFYADQIPPKPKQDEAVQTPLAESVISRSDLINCILSIGDMSEGILADAILDLIKSPKVEQVSCGDDPVAGIWHALKTDPDVYDLVELGVKRYEIRKNDRNFKVGDGLILKKTKHSGEDMRNGLPLEYTGDEIKCLISHVLHGYGLNPEWVILSIAQPSPNKADVPDYSSWAEILASLQDLRTFENGMGDNCVRLDQVVELINSSLPPLKDEG